MTERCHICKSKMVTRQYPMKGSDRLFRRMSHCSKAILHTYSEKSLANIDLDRLEEFAKVASNGRIFHAG